MYSLQELTDKMLNKKRPLKVLFTNDDGPPSERESPFVLPFVELMESLGWQIKVCLPDSQKSWISKSFLIKDTVHKSYYNRKTKQTYTEQQDSSDFVLLSGTPASCVNIAIHHLFKEETFDLVVSGPNLGRNSSTIYTLASGTVGAAMEAALCGYRAIALSFSFYSMNFEGEKSKNACEMASRVLQHLVAKNAWPDHGLFNVNVPLVDYACPVHLTRLDKTTCGSLFRPVSDPHSSSEKESSHKLLGIFSRQTPPPTPTMFKFAPAYATLPNTSPESGTDTWAIDHHYISVTPMVAAFGYPEKSVDYELETLNKL